MASTIPSKLRVNRKNTKYALRQAALRHLPEETAQKEKLGFPVPTRVWLRDEKFYNIVKEEFKSPTAQKFFNIDVIMDWLDDHYEGLADTSRKVWAIYVFLIWYKQYFGEVTSEEITEDVLGEVDNIEDVVTAAGASVGTTSKERLNELFGLAFDDEDGAGKEEFSVRTADEEPESDSETEE